MKIILKNICKSYGGKLIIDHVSLNLEDRHFTTLLGPFPPLKKVSLCHRKKEAWLSCSRISPSGLI